MKWFKKPLPAALILVLIWTACRLGFLSYSGIPQPTIHDEFSYLLGADTFAHGRLANPQHPLAEFFESPQILVHPKYASKYPPGQAMFLALGQSLFGSPFYGVLIGNALMLFTFCLMLFAWVPPRWALAVSVMFGLILWPSMYWTNSYWGGSVAASGGALVLLAIGVYRKRQTPLAGAIFAIGALLLFWTRPFEGGVFTITVLTVFARELWRCRRTAVVATAFVLLAIGGVWTCYDNKAVTGNPFLLPYFLHCRQYDVTPLFWFQPLHPEPQYSSLELAAVYGNSGWEISNYQPERPRWQMFGIDLIATLATTGWPLGLAVALTLLVPLAWRDPLYRKMAIAAGVLLIALSCETFQNRHYGAPAWAVLALMIAVWARYAWNLRIRKHPVGVALVLMVLVLPLGHPLYHHLPLLWGSTLTWSNGGESNASYENNVPRGRAALIERLSALDRRQLVIVRYPSAEWCTDHEWVYNGADIDHQQVIFAHDRGAEQNRALLNYYRDRTALLLTFDAKTGQEHIQSYSSAPAKN